MMACAVISKNNTYLTYFAFPRLSPSPVSFAPLNTFPYPHQTQQKQKIKTQLSPLPKSNQGPFDYKAILQSNVILMAC
jgi:hypothetical protein